MQQCMQSVSKNTCAFLVTSSSSNRVNDIHCPGSSSIVLDVKISYCHRIFLVFWHAFHDARFLNDHCLNEAYDSMYVVFSELVTQWLKPTLLVDGIS